MTLAEVLAVIAGIIFEVLLLLDEAQARKQPRQPMGVIFPSLSRLQRAIVLFLVSAWALIGLAYLAQIRPGLNVLSALQGATMFASFSFLFVFGLVDPRLLPRVNEQSILITSLVILPVLLDSIGQSLWLSVLVLLPSLALLLLVAFPRALPAAVKALIYFWYLGCLLIVTAQSNFNLFFKPGVSLSLADQFIAGQAGLFLLLNALFLVRFFLMLSALALPQNRHYITIAIPQLFSDEQIAPRKFFFLLGLILLVLVVNRMVGLANPMTLTNFLILLAVHGLDRPIWPNPKRV